MSEDQEVKKYFNKFYPKWEIDTINLYYSANIELSEFYMHENSHVFSLYIKKSLKIIV